MKRFGFALILVALVAPLASGDDPHGLTFGTQCVSCHATHKAAGQNLTNQTSNESLCASCHSLGGTAAAYPIENFSKADPANELGSSHAWNVPFENSAAGAKTPQNTEMAQRATGNLRCSICHDPHHGRPDGVTGAAGGAQYRSNAVRVAGGSTGTVTYSATAGAASKGYLIDITDAGNTGTAKFRLSNDGGLSWYGWSGSAWVSWTTANSRLTGSAIPLTDGNNLLVTFTGSFAAGDRVRFYVSYPFLRAALDSGDNTTGVKFCRDCHRDMAMDHNGTNSYDGTMRSHPVGVGLNANGFGNDRVTPLDVDGLPQGASGDVNSSNDLLLGSDGSVQCLTCHSVHNADGNSATVQTP